MDHGFVSPAGDRYQLDANCRFVSTPDRTERAMIQRNLELTRWLAPFGLVAAFLLSLGAPALAQRTTGTPGSPSATTTIDGTYLPPPPPKFGGQIGLSAQDSKSYWPPRVVPPKGAPNVLLIMTDD